MTAGFPTAKSHGICLEDAKKAGYYDPWSTRVDEWPKRSKTHSLTITKESQEAFIIILLLKIPEAV